MATASMSLCGDIPFASVKSLQSLGLSPQKEVPIEMPLRELNPYITCGICLGYLYEAATITECMHTFCKSCIVKHTERNITCPMCDIVIHPTDPLSNIKLDRTLQDIVTKLVPSVVQEEKRRKEAFYVECRLKKMAQGNLTDTKHKEVKVDLGNKLDIHHPAGVNRKPKVLVPSTKAKLKKSQKPMKPPRPRPPPLGIPPISLVLEYAGSSSNDDIQPLQKKYVRVQSDAKISNVLKFLRIKLEVPNDIQISMYCDADEMKHEQTLADIQKKYFQSGVKMLPLSYAISKRSSLLLVGCSAGDQNHDT